MLNRYTVVAFQTIQSIGREVEERGGGVCFVPADSEADWSAAIARLARERFRHPLGRTVELGIANLDEDQLASVCHRHGGLFWQGGDS
jgi:hypothetical protein